MPGLVGVVGEIESESAGRLLAGMMRAVKHEAWYCEESYVGERCGLGRLSLGFAETNPQPVWNTDRTVCALMEGELFDYDEQKRGLIAEGYPLVAGDDSGEGAAEFLLHLYEAEGEEFAKRLNGSFVAAIWDRSRRKLIVATDRMGSHPLYYAYHHQRLLFAPNVHGLLVDPELPRTVDRVAIAEALTFDHILGDRTWLTAVRLMPQASLLVWSEDGLEVRPYWTLKYADNHKLQSEGEYQEAFLHYLKQAVKRQACNRLPQGLYLSGGLDSRVLVAAMRDGPLIEPLATFTWGIPGCDDARFAAETAEQLRTQHHFFELKPDHLLHLVDKGVRLTNGSNCVHYHALASAAEAAKFAKVIHKAVIGDAIMGTSLARNFWADYDSDTADKFHFQAYLERGVLLFTLKQQEAFVTDMFRAEVNGALLEDYRRGIAASRATTMANQRMYFGLRQRIPRMTLNGVELVRSQAIVRTPYCDNDLLEFSLSVPPGLRFERHLMKKTLCEKYPSLAQIPITETNLPLTTCMRDVVIRSQRVAAWHLNRLGLRRTPDISRRPYADSHLWFRTVLRTWVTDTLLSARALDRGYFNPNCVRQLVAEHMNGANHAVKLGCLLSLELWHRQFLD